MGLQNGGLMRRVGYLGLITPPVRLKEASVQGQYVLKPGFILSAATKMPMDKETMWKNEIMRSGSRSLVADMG